MPRVQESGHIYFFYRPRVQHESAAGLEEVQRFHVLLNPRPGRTWRMITVGRKRLPELRQSGAGERLWAYVAQLAHSPDEVEGELRGYVYPTKTRGMRIQQPARPEGFQHRATPKEPARIQQGMNSLEGHGYQPPTAAYGRRHKLLFHLYALAQPLPDRPGLHAWELMDEAEGHVLAEATLPAFYVREQR